MRGLWLASALVVSAPGCVLGLGNEIACGDGFVDRQAGESCDPAVASSFIGACREQLGIDKPGVCDTDTCQVDLEVCFPTCGNGILEPSLGEECDPTLDDIVASGDGIPCVELDNDGPLEYAGGVSRRCLADCTYDRSDCHFCGDGARQSVPFEERCDGRDFVQEEQASFCFSQCLHPQMDPVPASISCQAICGADCARFVALADGLRCCLPQGEVVSPHVPCCNPPGPDNENICGRPIAPPGEG